MTKRQRNSLIGLVIVLLIGLGTSVDLTYIHYKVATSGGGYKSFCNLSDTINCDLVAQSEFSTMSGVPIAILGGITYLFSALLAAGRLSPRWPFKGTSVYLLAISVGSNFYSLFLAAICFFVIKAWCLMCMVLYGVNLAFLALAILGRDKPLKAGRSLAADGRWFVKKPLRLVVTALLGLALLGGLAFCAVTEKQFSDKKENSRETFAQLAKGTLNDPKFRKLDFELSPAGQIIGNPNGKAVIVLFSDYLCPFCAQMDRLFEKLAAKYPELKVIRKDFPLDPTCNRLLKQPFHPNACLVATYAQCAAKQGKYAAFHNWVLDHQREATTDALKAEAQRLGVDQAAFDACLADEGVRMQIAAEVEEGIKVKITGTPSLILDGRYFAAEGLSPEEVESAVQALSNR